MPAPHENCQEGIQLVLEVKAPVWRVYETWSHVEGFPFFIADITRVERLSDTESQWFAQGPSGETLQWKCRQVENIPNIRLAWHSYTGDLEQVCQVDIEALSPMRTQMTLHLHFSSLPEAQPEQPACWFINRVSEERLRKTLANFQEMVEKETTLPHQAAVS